MNNLENLSLRGNPLVVDFGNIPIYEPLTGRSGTSTSTYLLCLLCVSRILSSITARTFRATCSTYA